MFPILFIIVILIAEPALFGLVLSKLWDWFVVTQFNLHPLSIPAALGIALIISMTTGPHQNPKLEKLVADGEYIAAILSLVLMPFFFLIFGYIYHLFM